MGPSGPLLRRGPLYGGAHGGARGTDFFLTLCHLPKNMTWPKTEVVVVVYLFDDGGDDALEMGQKRQSFGHLARPDDLVVNRASAVDPAHPHPSSLSLS